MINKFGILTLVCGFAPCFAATVATFPPGTFLENIAVSKGGDIFTSAFNTGDVFEVTPSGQSRLFGNTGGQAFGLAFVNNNLYAAGGSNVYRFNDGGGTPTIVSNVAGATQLNGLTPLSPGVLLATDTQAGRIFRIDTNTGASRVWSDDPTLGFPPGTTIPFAADGLKIYNGAAYVTNPASGNVLRIPILSNGSAGAVQIYKANFPLDDIAIANDGSIFGAGQFGNVVERLAPDGTVTTVGGPADGILGDSALAFGRTAADAQSIYVANNGGAFENLPGGPVAGTVVRLNAGIGGVDPELEAVPEPFSWALVALGIMLPFVGHRYKQSRTYIVRHLGRDSNGACHDPIKS